MLKSAAAAVTGPLVMERRGSFSFLLAIALLLLSPQAALPAIRTVTNLDDSGPGSLREAIIVTASGDTINFAVTGTILLTSGVLGAGGKDLTITGPGSPDLLVVQRDTNAAPFPIFGFGGTVIVSGLTISRGLADSPYISGGGISSGGDLTLDNCVLVENRAKRWGGAIDHFSGTLTLVNCTFSRNSVISTFIYNEDGGGAVQNWATVKVRNCTFDSNVASQGGAIRNYGGSLEVIDSTFYRNSAYFGGGILNQADQDDANATFLSCTFSENIGWSGRGAGILNFSQTHDASLTIGNTILNNGTNGPNSNLNLGNSFGTVTSRGYNLCSDDAHGWLTGPGDLINTNPKLDPHGLVYDAGFTKTLALTPSSPAIDKGKSFGVTTDQRGLPRSVDNPNIPSASGGDGTDIGAYETASDPIQVETNLIVTTLADHFDGSCGAGDCSLREAIVRANEIPGVNTITFLGSPQGTLSLQTRTLGELVVQDSVSIVGPAARTLALSSDGYNRVFSFLGGTSSVSRLTIRDGRSFDTSGAGGTALAGGIYNQARLTLNDCTITENVASGGGGGTPGANGGNGAGGGILNAGTLTVNRCAFINNRAYGGAGAANLAQLGAGGNGGPAQGSAVFNNSTGFMEIISCTFFNNVANGGAGGQGGRFGGNGGNAEGTIYNQGAMAVLATTIVGNQGLGGTRGLGNSTVNHGVYGAGRGGLMSVSGNSTVRNTISASNIVLGFAVSVDVHGAFTSEGFNLIGSVDNSTGFTEPTDQTGTYDFQIDPMLGPMQNNGGETDTMAVRYGSPALDRGRASGNLAPTTDQRGSPRRVDTPLENAPGGDGADIGAFEVNVSGGGDSDGDGMSDDFERFYGVSDPNTDPDGDGLTNLQEFKLGLNPLAFESVNRWSNWASGSWQIGTNWSTTLAPASNQTCLIVNDFNKTITIDNSTVTNASATLTISNLTIAGGLEDTNNFIPGYTNTLHLSNMIAGGSQPLRVRSSLNIATGGALLISNSALHIDGVDDGKLTVDGTLTMHSGLMNMSNAVSTIGNIGSGEATVTGGNGTALSVFVAPNLGSKGTLSISGTGVLSCTNLLLGTFDCGSTAAVFVAGGSLLVTNAATNAVLEVRSGVLTISGGTVKVDRIVITNECARFSRTGGTLAYGAVVLNPEDDTDGDGLPNGWEQRYRLDPLDPRGSNGPTSDLDGDGQTALEEFLAGTDPTDAASSFRFLSIAVQGDDVRLRWFTAGGRTNALETASEPGGNTDFIPIATLVIPGSGPVTNTYVDVGTVPISTNRYYRLRLVQ
jgi:CSLREA domain-containing protein